MDRDHYKKMALSLKVYYRHGSLLELTSEQLENMPKEVMITCKPNEIALVWDKLPEHMKNDIDILKYQYSSEQYNNLYEEEESDVSTPRKLYCCYCKMRDVNITNEKIEQGKRRFSFNPLKCCKQQ